MKDGFGREIDHLRISLTDKCDLRCSYCMPEEGIRHLDHRDILTLEETARVAGIMSRMGIRRVRLTGGEPLVRRGAADLVAILRRDYGFDEIAMTSNGQLLSENAVKLRDAGLTDINISLDTLREDCFEKITRCEGGRLKRTLNGIDEALRAGLKVKLNSVLMKDINEEDLIPLVEYAGSKKTDIRFIELMPIGCGMHHTGIPTPCLIERLEERYGRSYPADSDTDTSLRGPARYYIFGEHPGRVGFISPLTHRFCDSCRRVRLTAEGFLKLCLQYPDGVDLRSPLRGGASDEEISAIILDAVKHKKASHSFDSPCMTTDRRRMVQIGG